MERRRTKFIKWALIALNLPNMKIRSWGGARFLIYYSWEVLDTLVTKPKVKYTHTHSHCTVNHPRFYFGGNNSIFSPCRSLSCHLERCLIRTGTKRIMIPFGHGPVEMRGCGGGASFSLSKLISLINDQQDDNPILWKCAPTPSLLSSLG